MLGNAKGVVAVILSLLYFRNPVTVSSLFGYGVTVTGVALYSQVCDSRKRVQAECREQRDRVTQLCQSS